MATINKVNKIQINTNEVTYDIGYKELDKCLNGLKSGSVITIGSRPAMGKSTFINNIVLNLLEKYNLPILYSCHPRSYKRIKVSKIRLDERIILHKPFGFHDYNNLQINAFAVLSDSGTLPEESSFFSSIGHSFPAVCIRTSTERPEALDKGCFILTNITEESLVQAVNMAVTMNINADYGISVPDYIEENTSTKVIKIIQSYVGIINSLVWKKV